MYSVESPLRPQQGVMRLNYEIHFPVVTPDGSKKVVKIKGVIDLESFRQHNSSDGSYPPQTLADLHSPRRRLGVAWADVDDNGNFRYRYTNDYFYGYQQTTNLAMYTSIRGCKWFNIAKPMQPLEVALDDYLNHCAKVVAAHVPTTHWQRLSNREYLGISVRGNQPDQSTQDWHMLMMNWYYVFLSRPRSGVYFSTYRRTYGRKYNLWSPVTLAPPL
jgi:hypothetical protein